MRSGSDTVALGDGFRDFLINLFGVCFPALDRTDWDGGTLKCAAASNYHQQIFRTRERHVDAAVVFHEFAADLARTNQRHDDDRTLPSLKLVNRVDLNIEMLPAVSTF